MPRKRNEMAAKARLALPKLSEKSGGCVAAE
jgi:hypothetical protein